MEKRFYEKKLMCYDKLFLKEKIVVQGVLNLKPIESLLSYKMSRIFAFKNYPLRFSVAVSKNGHAYEVVILYQQDTQIYTINRLH